MELLLEILIVSLVVNMLLFIPAYLLQTDKFTDIGYALTFIFVGLYPFVIGDVSLVYSLAYIVVLLWAIRLGGYLLYRILNMKKDTRFNEMRQKFLSFLGFWALQAVTVFVVSIGFTRLASIDNEFVIYSGIGLFIALIGLVIESLADIQKFKFKSDPINKGKWTDVGMWKYARHPNYFGEILVWWGLAIYASFYLENWIFVLSLISPVFITFMLLFVSGIPLLRKRWNKKWGNDADYKKYIEQTRLLVPLP